MEHISDNLFDNLMHFKYNRVKLKGEIMSVDIRETLFTLIYRTRAIYIDKYSSMKCLDLC